MQITTASETSKSFGADLRSWRMRRGLSQLDLALRCGTSQRHLSFLETSRARPSFLYVMYGLILWAIPMGLIAVADPRMAQDIAGGMTAYLRGIPEELYALFGTGYLGYTAARTWGKVKGVER